MPKTTQLQTTQAGIAARFWAWIRAIEEAASRDPTELLQDRIEILESRLHALEAKAATVARQDRRSPLFGTAPARFLGYLDNDRLGRLRRTSLEASSR